MNWCDHIKKTNGLWSFDFNASDVRNVNRWYADCYGFKFCPICGKPKPECKGLAEKLSKVYREVGASYQILAKTAIDHACDVIDEYWKSIGMSGLASLRGALKQALRESI